MVRKPVKYSVVDAFADSPFKGNPAAVCFLEEEEEREDEWLQSVAREFNISQTCYLTPITELDSPIQLSSSNSTRGNPRFRLRWFTPVAEVKLCGHATLAAAHCLFSSGLVSANAVEFLTLSGVLTATRVPVGQKSESLNCQNGEEEAQESFLIELDFPIDPTVDFKCTELSLISKALNGASFTEMKKTTTGDDILVELPTAKAVTNFQPQFDEIQKCPGRGILITAVAPPGSGFDFVSRFFCPKYGINEDPVCGSAHCALAPYWSKKLGKSDFVAYQASPRGGILHLHLEERNQRLLLRGKAIVVMEGFLLV